MGSVGGSQLALSRRKIPNHSLVITAAIVISGVTSYIISAETGVIGTSSNQTSNANASTPFLYDDSLALELVADGLKFPTSMRFLDKDNILVLQKNDGQVRLVSNDKLYDKPVLQLDNVANKGERGLLGIAIVNDFYYYHGRNVSSGNNDNDEVFLYFTENDTGSGEAKVQSVQNNNESKVLRNRVYKYDYDHKERILDNRTLILDLPGEPGPYHNGGKLSIGPYDGHLYVVIGDVSAGGSKLDNQIPGSEPDDKSVILCVDRETGLPTKDNPFYDYYITDNATMKDKLSRYYAYGIRNSFGMDFDHISQLLWITENGPGSYDEINLVRPGFNSGWHKVTGPISRTNITVESDLVLLGGARYDDPVFSWHIPIGITDIEFFNSSKLGDRYRDNIFVGDINNGNLYFFTVNGTRTGLWFEDDQKGLLLADLVADNNGVDPSEASHELSPIVLGKGFGRITDIETGPDGFLYVLTYEDGRIYRIVRGDGS